MLGGMVRCYPAVPGWHYRFLKCDHGISNKQPCHFFHLLHWGRSQLTLSWQRLFQIKITVFFLWRKIHPQKQNNTETTKKNERSFSGGFEKPRRPLPALILPAPSFLPGRAVPNVWSSTEDVKNPSRVAVQKLRKPVINLLKQKKWKNQWLGFLPLVSFGTSLRLFPGVSALKEAKSALWAEIPAGPDLLSKVAVILQRKNSICTPIAIGQSCSKQRFHPPSEAPWLSAQAPESIARKYSERSCLRTEFDNKNFVKGGLFWENEEITSTWSTWSTCTMEPKQKVFRKQETCSWKILGFGAHLIEIPQNPSFWY